ncbi:MAG: GGDEF domain-containing protein [Thermoanaerobaculia bacterium]
MIDALTGLPSLSGLSSALDETMAAVLLDIDGLRFVNHERGHVAGDDVLRRLGAWLSREAELLHGQVFRVAGDKFLLLLLLPGRAIDEAATIANKTVAICPSLHEITLSAVVFLADPQFPGRLRTAIDQLTEELYRSELASGRTHSNVVISGAPRAQDAHPFRR